MIRVPTSANYDQLRSSLAESQGKFNQKQLQITTGKRYLNRSEDPGTASEVAQVERQTASTNQFQKNVEDALGWTISTQAKTEDMVEVMQGISELLTATNNGTHNSPVHVDQGDQLDAMIEQLFAVSESKFGDTYMFSGTDTNNPPFTAIRDANGLITSVTSNINASTERRKTQINESTTVNIGELGGGLDGVLEATATGIDIFANLIAMRDEMLQGNIPPEADMLQHDTNMDHVIGKVTENGVKQQLLEAQRSSLVSTTENQYRQLDSMQGADMAASLTDLQQLQTSLQATMQMISRTNSMSILNFI